MTINKTASWPTKKCEHFGKLDSGNQNHESDHRHGPVSRLAQLHHGSGTGTDRISACSPMRASSTASLVGSGASSWSWIQCAYSSSRLAALTE
jgi:hypothetical protein